MWLIKYTVLIIEGISLCLSAGQYIYACDKCIQFNSIDSIIESVECIEILMLIIHMHTANYLSAYKMVFLFHLYYNILVYEPYNI